MTGLPFRRYAYVLLMFYIISDSYTEGRKRAQSVSLEVGPKYDGGPTSTEEFHKTELLNEKKSDLDTYDESGSPSKYSLHGSLYQPDPSSVWLERALSKIARGARVLPSLDPSHFEDDPFLVPRAASTKITGSLHPMIIMSHIVLYRGTNLLDEISFNGSPLERDELRSMMGNTKTFPWVGIVTLSLLATAMAWLVRRNHILHRARREGCVN